MQKQAIVITTIQYPTKSVLKFSKIPGFSLFVSGDNKTPSDWIAPNTKFISIQEQKQKYDTLSKVVAENHYARKNFAYLEAISSGVEYMFETDDDNFPNAFFPNFINKRSIMQEIKADRFVNIYTFFSKKNAWPRGLPLNYIKGSNSEIYNKSVMPLVQQSLADLDPDVDAIYRLTSGKLIKFKKGKIIALSKGTYCPFNSQATYWSKKAFPLLYLPSTINSRVTDIWRGYIAQRILWEIESRLIFLSPSVYQKRNIHNFVKDFRDELDLYIKTEEMVDKLNSLELSGNIPEMLTQVYSKLIYYSFFKGEELQGVKAWLSYLK